METSAVSERTELTVVVGFSCSSVDDSRDNGSWTRRDKDHWTSSCCP